MRRALKVFFPVSLSIALLFAALRAESPYKRTKDLPLGDFHQWLKLNDTPALLSSYVDGLCVGPTELEVKQMKADPHRHTYINVYVNKRGEGQMLSGADLPVGTVIVKEKLATPHGNAVMSTAMIKREAGYNPDCGDWEFDTLDATGTKLTSAGKNENCMSCHAVHKRNDHTFRFYLPTTVEDRHTYVKSGHWEIFPNSPYDH